MTVVNIMQGEIGAQEDSFKATGLFGQGLIADNHFASDEVKDKVSCKKIHAMSK